MVADKKVDKVADMVAGRKKIIDIDFNINMEIQFVERVGRGGCLIGPKIRPKAYPTCVSS